MRVPVRRTPQTRVQPVTEGFAQAVPGLDFSPLTDTIRRFAKDLDEEQKSVEEFDLQKRLIQETNELMTDFDRRKQEAPLGATGFTETVMSEYEGRHEKILDELYKKGFRQDGLEQLSTRLATLRQGFGERALAYQAESVRGAGKKQLDELGLGLSQMVGADPTTYASALLEGDQAVDNLPGLSAVEREDARRTLQQTLRQSGAKSIALTNPDYVIQTLDPQGLTAPRTAASLPGAAGGAYGIIAGLDDDRAAVASTLSAGTVAGKPVPTHVVAGLLGNFDVEGGYEGGQGDEGSASGIAQWRNERRANFRAQYGVDPHEATKQQQAAFVLWELNNPAAAGMKISERDAIINASTAEEAAALIDEHYERSSGEHRQRRIQAAADYASRASTPVPTDASSLGAVETIDPGASSAPAVGAVELPAEQTPSGAPKTLGAVVTGNPLLDDLSGPERLQVLAWAREKTNQQQVAVKGAMDVAITNKIEANLRNGEDAGPTLTREQVIAAYGPVEGEQKWAQLEAAQDAGAAIQKIKTLSEAQIAAEVEKLKSDPDSPTYAVDVKFYDAARKAQETVLKQREDDPAAYVFSAFPDIAKRYAAANTPDARRAVYGEMIRAYDQLGTPRNQRFLMTDEGIEQLGKQYNAAPPTGRVQILDSLLREMGPFTAGKTLGRAAGSEVAADFALYASFASLPNGRTTLARVFAGRDIIEKDPARKPTPAIINKTFAGTTGLSVTINTLDPDVSNMVNEAAAALYFQDGGRTDDGRVDSAKYQKALRQALGGTGAEGTGYFNDKKGQVRELTILPPGVSQQQFEQWVSTRGPGAFTRLSPQGKPPVYRSGKPVPINDILDDGVFVMTAPGEYGIKMASDGKFLFNSAGQPFLIRLDKQRMGIR
jgi:hypothetical protein